MSGLIATPRNTFLFELGGQYLLDPGEINGWGVLGPTDNVNSQDLGNVGATNLSRLAGGIMLPYAFRMLKMEAKIQSSSANAQAWGWVMTKHRWTAGSNDVEFDYILDEVDDNGGVGPRDYGSTVTQETVLDLSSLPNNIIEPREVFTLAVSAPTANTTNYYGRIMAGYLEMEWV